MAYLLGIGGGTGSGKGTIAKLINDHLVSWGLKSLTFSTDDCYKDMSYYSDEKRDNMCFNPKYNYDHPEVVDFERLVVYANNFKEGTPFNYKKYDFSIHSYGDEKVKVPKDLDVAIIEGIYALYSGKEVGHNLFSLYDHQIFVATTPETALIRRIRRDTQSVKQGGRGRDLAHVLKQLETTVVPMQHQFVYPSKINADDLVNWRVKEEGHEEDIKKKLIAIARQRALKVYEEVKGSLNQEIDYKKLDIFGLK